MSSLSSHVGQRIRLYRKTRGLTLQELSDLIHKSRPTLSKYESGEITMDIETLYDISQALQVSMAQLVDYQEKEDLLDKFKTSRHSLFVDANRLYFYFYDGRDKKFKNGIIDISHLPDMTNDFPATLSVTEISGNESVRSILFNGKVCYSEVLIRFSFANQYNPIEEALLYIFNPLQFQTYTEGMFCGISAFDYRPCAFKCVTTLEPQELSEEFRKRLFVTRDEIKKWQKLNMMLVESK